MAAIAESAVGGAASPRARGRRRTGSSASTVWRWVVLLIAGVYFLLPLAVALRFAGIKAFGSVVSETGFTSSLGLSVRLAIVTTVITIVLMLPTAVYVHLRLPRVRRLMEGITILPIVIPPVVLIVGVLAIAPGSLKSRRTCSRWSTWCWPCRSPTGPSTPAALAGPEDDRRGIQLAGGALGHHADSGDPAEPADRAAFGHRADRGSGAR